MIIKNQNASQLLLGAICRRQAPGLLDNENLSRATAWPFARSRQGKHAGAGDGPNEWRRDRSMPKVFPFHALTLWRSTTSLPWRVRRIYYSSARRVCGSLFRWSEPTEIALSAPFTDGSCQPNLDQDEDQYHRQSGPNKEDFLHPIVADDRDVIVHVRIAIEKLVPAAEDEDSGSQENSDSNAKGDAQRRDAGLFNYGNECDYLMID